MSKLSETKTLVNRLRAALEGGDDFEKVRGLVAAYNAACRQLKGRMDQIEAVLAEGSNDQVVRLCELDPPVLDQLNVLGFLESDEISRWCEENTVSFEGKFDHGLIGRINDAFSSAGDGDATLDKRYRRAVLKKDFSEAISILKRMSINRPDDKDLIRELVQIRKRYGKALIEKLATIGDDGPFDMKKDLINSIENINIPELLTSDTYQKAKYDVLRKHDEDSALKLSEYLDMIPGEVTVADWPFIEDLFGKVALLLESRNSPLPQSLQERWLTFKQTEEELRHQWNLDYSRKIAITELANQINHARDHRVSGNMAINDNLDSIINSLVQAATRLEELNIEIDDDLADKWRRELQSLKNLQSARRKASLRKRRLVIAGCAASVLLSGILFIDYSRANRFISTSYETIENRNRVKAIELVEATSNSFPSWFFRSGPTSSINELNEFLESDNELFIRLRDKIQLASTTELDANESPADAIRLAREKLADMSLLKKNLSRGYAMEITQMIDALQNRYELFEVSAIGIAEKRIEENLAKLEGIAKSKINPETSLSGLLEVANSVEGKVEAFLNIVANWDGVIKLRADQEYRIETIRNSIQNSRNLVSSYASAKESLSMATDLESYIEALDLGRSIDHPDSSLRLPLSLLPTSFNEANIRNEIIAKSFPRFLLDLLITNNLPPLFPETEMVRDEIDAYQAFMRSQYVENIYVASFQRPRAGRGYQEELIYSRGPLRPVGGVMTLGDRLVRRVTGEIYVPYHSVSLVRFEQSDEVELVDLQEKGRIPESSFVENLRLRDNISSDGMVSATNRRRVPFLSVLDELINHDELNALFRIYSIQNVFRLLTVANREYQWGLPFLPDLEDALTPILSFSVTNGDWLLPLFVQSNSDRYELAQNVLNKLSIPLRLEREAIFHRALAEEIMSITISFAGNLNLKNDKNTNSNLENVSYYALKDVDGRRVWAFIDDLNSDGWLDLSPVFLLYPSISNAIENAIEKSDLNLDEIIYLRNKFELN